MRLLKKKFILSIFSFVFFTMFQSQVALAAPGDAYDWNNYEDFFVIDHDTTWSGHITRTDIPKPVVIVNESVLTIAPGSNIEIGNISVYNGRIDAFGTETEPIYFTKQPIDYSYIPSDYAPECYFHTEEGMIDFSARFLDIDTIPSVFQNVVFDGLGTHEWSGDFFCPGMVRANPVQNLFFKKAYAQVLRTNPVLKVTSGRVRIEHSTFKNTAFADIETAFTFSRDQNYEDYYDSLEVIDSNLSGNTQRTAVIAHVEYDGTQDFSGKILLRNNWYGSPSGPTTEKNPNGTGEILSGTFTLDGWSDHEIPSALSTCTENCFSNILFLPGLEASRLYKDGFIENQLWEPNRNSDVEKLFSDEKGKSLDPDIYTREVLDEVNVSLIGQKNIYKSFLSDLDIWKNEEGIIADYSAIPYDWRVSLEDILTGGAVDGKKLFYTSKSLSPYIVRELRRLVSTSKTGKVTLVAHSYGGLVTKALTNMLGAEAESLIDKIVLVAVPQVGTPQTIGAILHGYDQGLPADWMPWILSSRTARILAQNMPSAYNLLPSKTYFNGNGSTVNSPVISFEDGTLTKHFIDTYGNDIDTSDELHDFLLDPDGKVASDSDDVVRPSTVNAKLLGSAQDVHTSLDDTWTIPPSIAVYQIAGFGEETLGTIRYWTGDECTKSFRGWCFKSEPKLQYSPEMVIDGDGTVVTPSALALSTNENMKRYWVDLASYDRPLTFGRKHADILEVPDLRNFIKNNIIIQSSVNLPEYLSDSEPSINSEKRLHYILHSPLMLSARDTLGNEVSATHSDIPGARYLRFGEVQYISIPAEVHPTLVLDGMADGSFTLEVEERENTDMRAKTLFSAIPSTAHSHVMMDFPDGTIEGARPLIIDYDGDGTDDHSIIPVLGGTAHLEDTLPPITTLASAGTRGTGDWYTSDVAITLSAKDDENGSGIEKTKYSLDNGVIWNTYTSSIILSNEGTTRVKYFSTDNVGNKEETKTQEIKIDKTAPEAKIIFNPDTQKIDIIGIDNLGRLISVVSTESALKEESKHRSEEHHWYDRLYWKGKNQGENERNGGKKIITTTLTDEAGHTTVIILEGEASEKNHLKWTVQSLLYDDISTEVRDTKMQYEWQKNWRGQYLKLDTHFQIPEMNLNSRYSQKKNETQITTEIRDSENEDEEHDDKQKMREKMTGMIIPSMITEKGMVKINY